MKKIKKQDNPFFVLFFFSFIHNIQTRLPGVRDRRQTDKRQGDVRRQTASSLNAPPPWVGPQNPTQRLQDGESWATGRHQFLTTLYRPICFAKSG